MNQNLIQQYSTSIVKGFIERTKSLSKLNHRLLKGELREIFVSQILKSFLTFQFGIGSGIIINQKGEQSDQTDIIIYDKRILPPFIKEQHLGVFPAECVLATLEIKSHLNKTELLKTECSSKKLLNEIYNPDSSIYHDYDLFKPTCAVLGFYGKGVKDLSDKRFGKAWLNEDIKYLIYIGITNKYSWINMQSTGWTGHLVDQTNDETKRFIAVFLDNIRTDSERRLNILSKSHNDWLGIYIRDQKLFTY